MSRFYKRTKLATSLAYGTIVLAGTFALGATAPAHAAHEGRWAGFQQFKLDNPGLSRHAVRQLYRSQFNQSPGGSSDGSPPPLHIPFIPSNHPVRNGSNPAGVANHLRNVQSPYVIDIRNRTVQSAGNGHIVTTLSGIDLNLDSELRNITLGGKLFDRVETVSITVGGQEKTLSAGSAVTAAEYIAAKQVLVNGSQSLNVDSDGRAVGGSVDLSQITAKRDRMRADDLTVPVNVTAYGDFGKGSTFQMTGDLVNAGSVYAFSSRQGIAGGTIKANAITNEAGALISSSLTESDAARLGSRHTAIDLTLQADEKLNNFGTISSSGDLVLVTPHVVNSGLVEARHGNVTIDTPVSLELQVDNRGGTVSAANGAINLHAPAFNGSFDTNVWGGDLLSKELNVNAGQGTANLTVGQLSGVINEKGFASHIVAATDKFTIGTVCLTGDPTYASTVDGKALTISGNISVGEALTIISAGDIVNDFPVTITAADGTGGFSITLIAGANVSATTGLSKLGPIPPAVPGTLATVDGTIPASAQGGSVRLGNTDLLPVTINARSTSASQNNGGDVLIAAFGGTNPATGVIDMPFSTINTGGHKAGTNGNVTFIAGGIPAPIATIITGAINSTGGTGGGGDVNLLGGVPESSDGNDITYAINGTQTSPNFLQANVPVASNSNILLQNNIKAGGNITMTAGPDGNINFNNFDVTANATGTMNITVTGTGTITGGEASTLSCETLNLSAGTGDIGNFGADLPIFTTAKFLTANGATGSCDILIVDFNPGLILFSGTGLSINLATQGSLINNPAASPIDADTMLIGSFAGNTGLSALNPLEVNADTLFIAATVGSAWVHNSNTGLTTLDGGQPLKAAQTLSLMNDGDLAMLADNKIQGSVVDIQVAGNFVGFDGSVSGSKSVSLTAGGASDILSTDITAVFTTPVLKLTSLTQDIGTSGNRFTPSKTVGAISAFAPNGSVFLQGPSGVKKAGVSDGFANNTFDYLGSGSTAVTGNIATGNGDLNIVTTTGTLTVGAKKGASTNLLSANDLTLKVSDPTSTKSKISILNASVQTSAFAPPAGLITISVGVVAGVPVPGTPPSKGVGFGESGGGQIFWGQSGISAKGNNSVVAKGTNVVFNNPLKSSSISLGGGSAIVADPPVPLYTDEP